MKSAGNTGRSKVKGQNGSTPLEAWIKAVTVLLTSLWHSLLGRDLRGHGT